MKNNNDWLAIKRHKAKRATDNVKKTFAVACAIAILTLFASLYVTFMPH